MYPDGDRWCRLIRDCGIASTAVTATVMAAGQAENGTMWRAINAVSHILLGERATAVDHFEPAVTLPGIALNTASVSAWMMLYQLVFGRTRWSRSLVSGLVGALVAYAVDYSVLPKRLTPGFEDCLSPRRVALVID